MGSGSKGPYGSSSGGGSQPYAPTYHVVKDMMEADKKDPNIYNPTKGYFKNPLAATVQDDVNNGQIQMNGHSAHGTFPYVLTESGDIVFAKRFNPNNSHSRSPHPTLVGGKDPQVVCAGMIHMEKGRIVWYNNDSGHFKPNAKSLDAVDKAMTALKKSHPEIFAKNYEGGRKR